MAVIDVKLTDPEAHRLADMARVHQDLRMVAATAAQLSRRREEKAPDMHVLESMLDLALIRYGRCYKGGVRNAFTIPQEWIDALPAELRQAHRDFLDLRDKHIAHSVDDWEINMPVARVHVDEQINDVTVKAARWMAMVVPRLMRACSGVVWAVGAPVTRWSSQARVSLPSGPQKSPGAQSPAVME